jgi:hypothetical protein
MVDIDLRHEFQGLLEAGSVQTRALEYERRVELDREAVRYLLSYVNTIGPREVAIEGGHGVSHPHRRRLAEEAKDPGSAEG